MSAVPFLNRWWPRLTAGCCCVALGLPAPVRAERAWPQVALPAGAQAVYLRWQSRDAEGRTSRLSAVHRVTPNNTGLRTQDNNPVKGGDNTIGTGNSPLQQPR